MPNPPFPQATQFDWSKDPKRSVPDGLFKNLILRESVSRRQPNYSELPYGSPFPWKSDGGTNPYPDHQLCFQAISDDGENVIRFYTAPRMGQNSFNVAKYENDEENRSFPWFTRVYIVPRISYQNNSDPSYRAMLTPLNSLIGIRVSNGGHGYVPTIAPIRNGNSEEQNPLYVPLVFTGGGGTGAAGQAEILDGVVVAAFITNDGSGYTTAPTITISGPGAGASFQALIQDTSCVIVAEEAIPMQTQDQPIGSLYLMVTQKYWTLPGAEVSSYELGTDAQGAGVDITRQKFATPDLGNYVPDFRTLAYSDKAINANVFVRNLRTLHDPAFPILTEYDQDEETLTGITTTYQVVDASAVVAPSIVQGQITTFKKIDKWRSLKIVRVFDLPAEYTEGEFGAWTRPFLFDFENAETPYSVTDGCGAFGVRYSQQSILCPHKTVISFSTSRDTSEGLVFSMNAPLMGKYLNFQNIINDEFSFTYFGDCTGTVTVPASTPDFTAYVTTLQETFQLMAVQSKLWKALYYRTVKLYIKLPPTTPS